MSEELFGRLLFALVMPASGVLLIWMARATAAGRLGRNSVAGIRIGATMASDEAWRAAHRRAKRPTQWAGWIAIASGVPAFLPVAMPIVVGSAIGGCLVMLALVLYGAVVGSRAARRLDDHMLDTR